MTAPILVTGGTGTLGRLVTPLLRDAGVPVRVLSRTRHDAGDGVEFVVGDLASGAGVDAAVSGVSTIVHCAGNAKGDGETTQTLVHAVAAAGGNPHLVFISVVGADRMPVVSRLDRAMFGYFASKRSAELAVEQSGLPWTTLRATQFHELTLMTAQQMAKSPVIPVPTGVRFQPVDAAEVAARLAELALDRPSGLVPDIAGPRAYKMGELLRGYLRATGRRRLLVPVRLPGGAARALRAGANLALDRSVGRRTWEGFLADRVATPE